MRVIARRERPHPGAQLRITDINGWRITCFATNTPGWPLADLEVRHRQRARAEDRIRALKDTGMRNLPFHSYPANQIWLELVALAADLLTWTQTLAFTEHAPVRRWEPKRLRLRILAVAGRITAADAADDSDYPATGPGTTSSTPDTPHSTPPKPATPTPAKGHQNTQRPQRRSSHLPKASHHMRTGPHPSPEGQMKARG